MAFLQVENLSKRYGASEVLKNVGFSMEKGEVLSIIGSSGSGKTTLLRCLNALEEPDAGRIVMNGETVFDASEKRRRTAMEGFGLVFQNFNLFPQYTALKNITLAMDANVRRHIKKSGVARAERSKTAENLREFNRETAMRLLERVNLADKADLYPYQLSGGQCQRVAIARALALSPAVLCFDEPTSALDPLLTNEVLSVIRSLKSKDMTMIIVTHEMEFARGVSDKIAFMSEGVIADFGTPDEIFGSGASGGLKNFLKGVAKEFDGEERV